LALEGRSDDGLYFRYAKVLGAGTGAMLTTKGWSPFIFPVDDLPAEGLSELRVRFDLSGPGEVWIDDVKLYDLAFIEKERNKLTKLIALADLKLESKQLADCTQLLDGYWPHFLLAHVPLAQSPTLVAEKPASRGTGERRPAEPTERAKKPGRLEQMRDYLQKKLW
jgi:hypothetical protein